MEPHARIGRWITTEANCTRTGDAVLKREMDALEKVKTQSVAEFASVPSDYLTHIVSEGDYLRQSMWGDS